MTTKSLVTGAGGFVGRHLVDALVQRGDDVIAADIGDPADPVPGARYEKADVRDAEAMRRLAEGRDTVFHNASVVHTRRTAQDMVWNVNHGGTKNIIEACRAEGVTRLIYVSSASVVYEGRDIENGDESMPYSSISQAPYADSKIAAERDVLRANDPDAGLLTCALRPHVIFGPGDGRFLPAIIERAEAGKLKTSVGRGDKLSDFTYVSNLVDALLAADDKLAGGSEEVAGEAYFITNGEPRPFFGFVKQVLAGLELPPIRGSVPYRVAYSFAAIAETFDKLRGRELVVERGLSRFAVRYMCTHHYFNIEKASRDLDWTPGVSLDEGIAKTVEAIRA